MKFDYLWIKVRFALSSLVALWGFYLLFTKGATSGGDRLLIIASIGYLVGIVQFYLLTRKNRAQ